MQGEELRDARQALAATRSVVKATQRSCRTALQFLADLDERLDALENAQPEEAQRDGQEDRIAAGRGH